jgi:hypothetical protein
MSTPADSLNTLNSDKLASAIAQSGEKIASVIAAPSPPLRGEHGGEPVKQSSLATELRGQSAKPRKRRQKSPKLPWAKPVVTQVYPGQKSVDHRRSSLVVMGGIAMLIVAVVVGVVAGGQWSLPAVWQQVGDHPVEFAASGFRGAAPRLLVQASRATSGEPTPLGLALQGRADDAVVMITGLVPGMTVSIGAQIGVDTWQVPATDLPGAWIGPPTNFVGVVDLVAELHLANKTIADRRPLKLEWGAAIPATAAASPTVETGRTAVTPPREQYVAPSRQLDADEPMVETAWIGPPTNFVGVVDLVAELHLETDRTAVALPREQNVAPPRQLGADEPMVETDRTAVALSQEQNVGPPRQLGDDEPMVETDRTAVALSQEQNVGPPRQLGADELTVETDRNDRTAVAPAAASPKVETDRTTAAPPREQNVAPPRQLDADEIAALLKRGEDLIRSGDLAAARLVLQRAAEAKSAEAALTLAATYDPVILRELRVYGFASDVEMARSWHEKATDRTAVTPPREQDVAPSRQLDVEEIAALIKHGENYIRNGDFAAARLVLQRAAEAKSAEAALMLAATYDPVILRELRVYGFASDVGMARSWYEKAKEFGSAAASQRLEILISAAR